MVKKENLMLRYALVLFLLSIGVADAQAVLPPIPPAVACIYNAAPPTVQTGQAVYVQCDAQGRLLNTGGGGGGGGLVTQGTSPWVVSGSVSATQGTSPWAISGSVSQGAAGSAPWPVTISPSSAGLSTQATNSLPISVSSGTTQIIPAVAGKAVYVTGWNAVAASAGNILLEYGSGTNCGTGTAALTGTYAFPAGSGISAGTGLGPMLFAPAGDAVCVVTTAPFGGFVSYAQF